MLKKKKRFHCLPNTQKKTIKKIEQKFTLLGSQMGGKRWEVFTLPMVFYNPFLTKKVFFYHNQKIYLTFTNYLHCILIVLEMELKLRWFIENLKSFYPLFDYIWQGGVIFFRVSIEDRKWCCSPVGNIPPHAISAPLKNKIIC